MTLDLAPALRAEIARSCTMFNGFPGSVARSYTKFNEVRRPRSLPPRVPCRRARTLQNGAPPVQHLR